MRECAATPTLSCSSQARCQPQSTGKSPALVLSTYVVENGKPIATIATPVK